MKYLLVLTLILAGCSSGQSIAWDLPNVNRVQVTSKPNIASQLDQQSKAQSRSDNGSVERQQAAPGFIDYRDFYKMLNKGFEGRALVMVTASWCEPCQVLGARLKLLDRDELIVLVDVDELPPVAKFFLQGRQALPQLIRLKAKHNKLSERVFWNHKQDLGEFIDGVLPERPVAITIRSQSHPIIVQGRVSSQPRSYRPSYQLHCHPSRCPPGEP